MSREQLLKQLLQNPNIWRSGRFRLSDRQPLATGFSILDQRIGGGWSLGVLTEILLDSPGIGELALLMPALSRLCPDSLYKDQAGRGEKLLHTVAGSSGWCSFIAPPYIPYAPALASHGLDVSRLLVVSFKSSADTLWVMEQALRSEIFVAVFGWFAEMDTHALRRLQLAAEAGMCWSVIFRHTRFARNTSPAALRIHLEPGQGDMQLHILRNRYGPIGSLSIQC